MQPTYFPWVGYFKLINSVDNFVFYDDSQYSKGSWHNRNKVAIQNNIKWITVPILKPKLKQNINQIKIDLSKDWKNHHISLINQFYKTCKFHNDLKILLNFLEEYQTENLSNLNISLIKFISNKLNIQNNFYLSSNINIDGDRSDKIINICNYLKSDTYLSPQGAKNYLEQDGKLFDSSINIEFHNFIPKKYNQNNLSVFDGNLSIIDIIANIGWDGLFKYLNTNENYKQKYRS